MFFLRRNVCIGLFLLTLLVFPGVGVFAATIGFSETYTLPTGSTIADNAYIAGGTVIISGPIEGDALTAGVSATFSGIISGDALIAAGSLEMLGPVLGNLRSISGSLTVSNEVRGDASVVSGAVSFIEGSRVLGDVLLVGGKTSLLGTIEGNVYLMGGDVFIDGRIGGNVFIYSGGKIRVGENAVIGGDFTYRGANEAVINPEAVIIGSTNFEYIAPAVSAPDVRGFFAGLFGILFVARVLMVVSAALFFVLVFRRMSGVFMHESKEGFWKNCLIGLAVFLFVPVVSFVLALTVFGGIIAFAVFFTWLLLLLLAHVYTGILAATLFRIYILRRPLDPLVSWKMAVLGVLAINILCLVPYVGLLLSFVLSLTSLGILSQIGYRHFILAR